MTRLRNLSRDSWLAIGVFTLLVIITAVSLYQETRDDLAPPLASFSTQPDGGRALWLWLDEMGYTVTDRVTALFQIPPQVDVALMLQPLVTVLPGEWEVIDEWVEAGGTLVIVGDRFLTDLVIQHYEFRLDFRSLSEPIIAQQTPLMTAPFMRPLPQLDVGQRTLQTDRDDFVTHVAVGQRPLVVSFPQGNGRVFLSTVVTPFTNVGLQEAGHPQFVMNFINAAGQQETIWFDEWHHGIRVGQALLGPGNWLRRTPLGRSFLYVGVVIFVALLLRGRLFGRPVPLPQDTSRRAPLEYITALANLSRRAGHRTAVLHDYHHRLKKELGHRYRLDPTLPDAEFVSQLEAYQPHLDEAALLRLLTRLRAADVSEAEMVQLAQEVSEWRYH